jgi:hypothetical protein
VHLRGDDLETSDPEFTTDSQRRSKAKPANRPSRDSNATYILEEENLHLLPGSLELLSSSNVGGVDFRFACDGTLNDDIFALPALPAADGLSSDGRSNIDLGLDLGDEWNYAVNPVADIEPVDFPPNGYVPVVFLAFLAEKPATQ